MDAAEFDAFVQYLKDQRLAVDLALISAAALLFYEWSLNIAREISLVWLAPWNYTTVPYLLTRFLPMINTYFLLHDQLSLNVDPNKCDIYFRISSWFVTIGLTTAELILCVRTWAVWKRNLKVGLVLAALQVTSIVLDGILATRYLNSIKVSPSPYEGFRGCFVVEAEEIIYINFIVLALNDAVVLALMSVSAFRMYRMGNTSELSNVVHRDGILFYLYLLCFTVANVILILVARADFAVMLTFMQSVAYSAFACRIILNIRTAGSGGVVLHITMESHIASNDTIQMSGMAFRPGLETHYEEDETDSILRSLSDKKPSIAECGSDV